METPIVELPNNENKLFDKDDDVGASTIPYLSLPIEGEEEDAKSNDMLLTPHLNFLHFILKEKVSESGSNIKTWRLWNSFSNGVKMKKQLENPIHPFKRLHGIRVT